MAKATRRPAAFLNIPYDFEFEDLYLAYVVGLTQLGFDVQATLGVPSQNRLETIISLIERCEVSIHDLSRIELSIRTYLGSTCLSNLDWPSTVRTAARDVIGYSYSKRRPIVLRNRQATSTGLTQESIVTP